MIATHLVLRTAAATSRFMCAAHRRSSVPFRSLCLIVLLIVGASPASAQRGPEPGRTESLPDTPPAPIVDTNIPSMTFRIVEGQGVFGLSRWIQASGRFVRETPEAFAAFARDNNIRGLTVFLDSGGGSLPAGLALGRAFRAAGVDTAAGRTVTRMEGGRQVNTIVTHAIGCHSACAYAFMGGLNRRVPTTARIGVHQFSQRIDASGRPVDAGFGMQEFRNAQEVTARIAVYTQEMGIDARLLEIAASAPFGQPIRILTSREISDLRFGTPVQIAQTDRAPVGWSLHERADAPMLYRLITRPGSGPRRVDEELIIGCGRNTSVFPTTFRAILARPADRSDALRATGIRIASGDRSTIWRRRDNERPLEAQNANGSLWAFFAVDRTVFDAAARSNRLSVEVAPGAAFEAASEFGDGFQDAWSRFANACEARNRAAGATR